MKIIQIPTGEEIFRLPFEYFKREGRRFYFRNEHLTFDVELFDKDLYDFVDQYNLGDWIRFNE